MIQSSCPAGSCEGGAQQLRQQNVWNAGQPVPGEKFPANLDFRVSEFVDPPDQR